LVPFGFRLGLHEAKAIAGDFGRFLFVEQLPNTDHQLLCRPFGWVELDGFLKLLEGVSGSPVLR
jgi:hypothetical protein